MGKKSRLKIERRQEKMQKKTGTWKRRVLKFILAIMIIAAVGAGGYYGYKALKQYKDKKRQGNLPQVSTEGIQINGQDSSGNGITVTPLDSNTLQPQSETQTIEVTPDVAEPNN